MRCTIPCFMYRITENISDIQWAMLRNGWRLFFNCVPWFLTLSNKVEKYLCIWFVCMNVCPSISSCSNCHKYCSNFFKFTHVIHIWYRMNGNKNDMYGTKDRFRLIEGGGFLKLNVAYFYCSKYKEINTFHSVVQKHDSYAGSHKRFLIYYGLCLETYFKLFFMICFCHTKF